MYDFTPLQLFYSAFRCPATWTPAGVGAGRVGVGVVRLIRYEGARFSLADPGSRRQEAKDYWRFGESGPSEYEYESE
jgi:hypothetical protein